MDLQAQVNIITTIAGKAGVPASDSGDGGPATNARFYGPYSICLDASDNLIIADGFNNKIRKISSTTGIITTIGGTGDWGYSGDNVPATSSKLYLPHDVKADALGNIYIADANNYRIRKIDTFGIITTIAGNGSAGAAGDGNAATNASLNQPTGLCFDKHGNMYIADFSNYKVRRVDASTGIITTIAGNGGLGFTGDNGPATNATFAAPVMVCTDSDGHVFVSDLDNHVVRKIDVSTGIITTIAGTGVAGNSGDGGLATNAQLNKPIGVFIDKQNNIFIPDFGPGVIRRVDAKTGIITTIAGNGTWGYAGDGGPPTAAKLTCTDMAIDSYGSMIIADYGSNTIRKVYNPQLSLNVLSNDKRVSVYPNPASDEITVEYNCGNSQGVTLQLTDVTGRTVLTETLDANKEKQIDIHSLPQGFYLYKVLQDNLLISSGKIIKE